MSISRFYAPEVFAVGSSVKLDTEQSRHALKSRRLKAGDVVELLNGEGQVALAKLIDKSSRSAAIFEVNEARTDIRPENDLTIAAAVPKGDRQKVMVDMLAQLGVARVVPLNCEYSSTRANSKLVEKWRRLVIESCKLSGRTWFQETGDSMEVLAYAKQVHEQGLQLILADHQGEAWQEVSEYDESQRIVCLVGPEGGFSESEIEILLALGARSVAVAPNILRIETAAVAIATAILTRLIKLV